MIDFIFAAPEDIMARTIVGEARGEGAAGMAAVACVIMNRANNPGWWGKTVKDVCLKKLQFSCWNQGDPNRAIIEALGDGFVIYRDALEIAKDAISGASEDFTNGATHYYAKNLKTPPSWSEGQAPCYELGNHVFFNLKG